MNAYFGSNAQPGVNGCLYLILERKSHQLSRTVTNAKAGVNGVFYLILERKSHELSRTATNFLLSVCFWRILN